MSSGGHGAVTAGREREMSEDDRALDLLGSVRRGIRRSRQVGGSRGWLGVVASSAAAMVAGWAGSTAAGLGLRHRRRARPV
ncbi:hypothetical protein Dimus_004052, partial [Dionaea muscipula]